MTGNGILSTYEYDANGNLTEKAAGPIVTEYSYNQANLPVSVTNRNEEMVYNGYMYTYTLDGNRTAENETNGISKSYQYDGLGRLTRETQTGEGKQETYGYSYDAFGNEQNPDETDMNPFRYAGEYFDQEIGNTYLRNRYYAPNIGRFITEDPIRDGLNWYIYANNNPITYADPMGLEFDTLRNLVSTSVDGSIEVKEDHAIVKAYGKEAIVYFDPNKNSFETYHINGTLAMERSDFLEILGVDAIERSYGEYEISTSESYMRTAVANVPFEVLSLYGGMLISKVKKLEDLGKVIGVTMGTLAMDYTGVVKIEAGTYIEEHFYIKQGNNVHSIGVITKTDSTSLLPKFIRTSSVMDISRTNIPISFILCLKKFAYWLQQVFKIHGVDTSFNTNPTGVIPVTVVLWCLTVFIIGLGYVFLMLIISWRFELKIKYDKTD